MQKPHEKPGTRGPLDRERAFTFLFRQKTFKCVWRWLRRLGVSARDRHDLRQEVFLAAHRSFHAYDPARARPERWLNRITVHVASHYHERAFHRREELTADPARALDRSQGPHEQVESDEEHRLLLELLYVLDVNARAVLVAHDIDGIPMVEIAQRIGIPVSTAYKRRARGMAALKEAWRERLCRTGAPLHPPVGVDLVEMSPVDRRAVHCAKPPGARLLRDDPDASRIGRRRRHALDSDYGSCVGLATSAPRARQGGVEGRAAPG